MTTTTTTHALIIDAKTGDVLDVATIGGSEVFSAQHLSEVRAMILAELDDPSAVRVSFRRSSPLAFPMFGIRLDRALVTQTA